MAMERNRKRGAKLKYKHLYPKVNEMLLAGVSMRKIAEELGMCASTVYNVALRLEKGGCDIGK